MSIPRMVIVAYRPKPGRDDVLLSEVRDHVHLLRSEGLATDRPASVMRAGDGTLVEMFEWASPAAIEEAHANPRVQAMWARFEACCETVALNSLDEARGMFGELETVQIQSPPIVQPEPDKRAE